MGIVNREAEEDTGAIQTFAVTDPDDPDMLIENPDLTVNKEMPGDYNAAEVMALETVMLNAQKDFIKSQKEDFPAEEFQTLVDKTIMARIDIEGLVNERVKNMPKEQFEQTGYQ